MKKRQLDTTFDWQRWDSTESDLKSVNRTTSLKILFKALLINRFENALLQLKNADCVWGPVHSSVGQEAAAAAAISALRRTDRITGSHRAHHQFLSKAVGYVLPDGWDPLRQQVPPEAHEVVRRTLAEIMGLAPGYCGGRGGSMHLRWAEAGILGTNAIVGGGIPIATGAAYAEKHRGTDAAVVCFFGDGAANQGAFHEALNLAGLWRLPILYFIENNGYAVGTRHREASAVRDLSLRASSYAMKGRIVEGHDVLAVYEVVRDALERIRRGEGPFLIEARCYRHYHHAGDKPGSAYGYRKEEEEEEHLERDALRTFPASLAAAGILSEKDLHRLEGMAEESVHRAVEACTQPAGEGRRVRPELWPDPGTASEGLRSDGLELEGLPYGAPQTRSGLQEMKYSDAIAAVTWRWMERDAGVVEFGEEIANFGGGAYGATKGLPARFPRQVVNTPISEAGFTGLALGAAMSGLKSIVELMFPDFALVAADQLFNQIGKARHMYGGATGLPLVVRTRIAAGCGYGGQHSMDPVGLFALFPGWRVVAPSDSAEYIGLFNTAMYSLDPVLLLEHHSLYGRRFPVPRGDLDYCLPFGRARLLAPGGDVTVIAYSAMSGRLLALQPELQRRGVSAEIIDLRTVDLPGIDYDTIGASLKKTGAVAIVEEAASAQGIGGHIAAEITGRFFDDLDAPPSCLSSLNVPAPVSRVLETAALVQDEEILARVEAVARRRWL